ncbi:MAG: cardiolipin synthase [Oscillospiraceae bacterium]
MLMKIVFSRIFICAIGIVIQLAYLAFLFWTLGTIYSYSYIIFIAVGIAVAVYIMNRELSPGYKLIWVFSVLSFPIFGCMVYFFFGRRKTPRAVRAIIPYLRSVNDDGTMDELLCENEAAAKQARYISRNGFFPLYKGCETEYFSSGEELYDVMLRELEKAQHFIFLEFFILDKGMFWDRVLSILERKAAENVEVRLMYDDFGCLLTLPRNYRKELEDKGIRCCVFGRLKPFWTARMNYRDHRKILVVDGKTAITGGINLADEYINVFEKHGYWKDSALLVRGNAVNSFTAMFLQLWDTVSGESSSPDAYITKEKEYSSCGYCAPYSDSPDDSEMLCENVYLNMLYGAKRYVYITTPYLILDSEIQEALILAAKNGIDVRIITPHIPDKKFVHAVTRSNYSALLRYGVRIYEFLPGFIHAKNFVSDDSMAVVGTINLDFRSLYLHYECGVWMCSTDAVAAVKADFLNTLKRCKEVTLSDTIEKNPIKRVGKAVLRLFSPMM